MALKRIIVGVVKSEKNGFFLWMHYLKHSFGIR